MKLHGVSLRDRFPALDGLRAIGALAVLTTHVGFSSGASLEGTYAGFLARLDVGVALFFVVSGFLLYRPHVVSRMLGLPSPRVGSYLWHRSLRILPALWVAVALAATTLPHAADVSPVRLLRHAGLVQIYTADNQVAGLTQLWSLATEAAFYLALPGVAWLLHRRGGSPRRWAVLTVSILALTTVAGPAWMAFVTVSDHALMGLWLPGYCGWFGVGMMLAVWNVGLGTGVFRTPQLLDLAQHPWTCWAAAAALFALLTTPIGGPFGLSPSTGGAAFTKSFCYALIGLLAVLPAVGADPGREGSGPTRALGSGPWAYAGGISYGIFLYHVTVLGWVERAIDHRPFSGDFGLLFAGTVVVTSVVAGLSYRFLERPLMRWGRHNRRFDVRTASSLDDVPGADHSVASTKAPSTST